MKHDPIAYSSTLGSQHREQYRHSVTNLDIPDHEIDALIDIVHAIISHFVDAAFNVQTDQITMGTVRSNSINSSVEHAKIAEHPDNHFANGHSAGANSDSNPIGPSEP